MKLIHVTDPHLVPAGERLHGLDPQARLEACIADINRHHGDADLCVVTGDLADGGRAAAYDLLRRLLADLEPPVHLILGNHDDRAAFRAAFPAAPVDASGFVQAAHDLDGARLLFLDTLEAGTYAGVYGSKRRAWLGAELDRAAADDVPVYLFLHHPPFRTGLAAMDRIGLRDPDGFAAVVTPHAGRIRHLFFGHLHRPLAGNWRGISFSTIRATNHQVWIDFENAAVATGSHEPPAYAIVLADADQVVVHAHDFLDISPKFALGPPDPGAGRQ